MNSTYATLTDRFSDVVDAVTDWSAASPCEGWSVGDVVDHVVTTQRDFLRAHTDVGPDPREATLPSVGRLTVLSSRRSCQA